MRLALLSVAVLIPLAAPLCAADLAADLANFAPLTRCQEPKPAAKPKGDKPAEKPAAKPAAEGGKAEGGKAEGGKADAAKGDGAWVTSYEDAIARAKKEKKLILADFTGSDWCHWCKQLDAEVFSTADFLKWADKNVILLQVDFPRSKELPKELKEQNEKLQKEFKIEGFPTVLFLDSKGKSQGQMGYQEGGPEKWTKAADKILKKAK